MPTVIVLDISKNMEKRADLQSGEPYSIMQYAVQALKSFLDYVSVHQKLEYVSLIVFNTHFEVLSGFTRDVELLKGKLMQLKCSGNSSMDLTHLSVAGIEKTVVSEWGRTVSCNILLVTQDNVNVQPGFVLPFSFPGNMFVFAFTHGLFPLSDSMENALFKCKMYRPELPITANTVQAEINQICKEHYCSWIGSLQCGNFSSRVILAPNPIPYHKVTDFDSTVYVVDRVVEVCGFIELQRLGSPASVARHLVLPYFMEGILDNDTTDDSTQPSFCVLLHGALKVENMAALCRLGNDWFGVLYSRADTKKKSNLMLSLLEPGPDSVPWLGNLNELIIPSSVDEKDVTPIVTVADKRNSQNCIAWIRQPGLQSDIQKILRHSRKLPDKTQHFYKELNRVRRSAICLGFTSLLEGLAAILERECTILPGSAHPACAFQLTHASSVLRQGNLDPSYSIQPMKMQF